MMKRQLVNVVNMLIFKNASQELPWKMIKMLELQKCQPRIATRKIWVGETMQLKIVHQPNLKHLPNLSLNWLVPDWGGVCPPFMVGASPLTPPSLTFQICIIFHGNSWLTFFEMYIFTTFTSCLCIIFMHFTTFFYTTHNPLLPNWSRSNCWVVVGVCSMFHTY